MSEDGKVAVASSLITLIISSIMFFASGYFCHHCRQKPQQTSISTLPVPVKSATPLYENVLLEQDPGQDLELKENVAYGPIATPDRI